MTSYATDQEQFWAGKFGTEYITRNQGDKLLASNLNFFSKALRNAINLKSCVEFGANVGMNLRALRLLYPAIEMAAIEINSDSVIHLRQFLPADNVWAGSILDYSDDRKFDLALIKGVLIHLNPEYLDKVYEKLEAASGRYILVAEYYNPSPVSIPYRGHADRLYKRDFAGEILERYPSLKLSDYGFSYRRDPNFPQDDITWFLLERI